MPFTVIRRDNSRKIKARARARVTTHASDAEDKDTELRTAEALPSRAKARVKVRPKVMVKARGKVRVQLKGVRVPKADALHVVDHTTHLHAQKGKGAARPRNLINKWVGNKIHGEHKANRGPTHGEHKANREPTTRCPNPWGPMGHRECTPH